MSRKPALLFTAMGLLLILLGQFQSWSVALAILNLCLVSAVMSLGVNLQWGMAGLFNVATMGFVALGGLTAMLVSVPPVPAAWAAGGRPLALAGGVALATVVGVVLARRWLTGRSRSVASAALAVVGGLAALQVMGPAVGAIESVEAARFGFLGGMGLPILLSWLLGGVCAAAAAWVVAKTALGLRADYLAITTLGISEIIIAILRNEDWLTRGVKNVTGLPRPVPLEIELQAAPWLDALARRLAADPVALSGLVVKLAYAGLFAVALLGLFWLCERALHSPWGRMMRALRDDPEAAAAMGKDVTGRQLQVFVLGSAILGIGGAMLTTLDGQFTPGSYNPLRYTFLIWVMVILGGSGNNKGAVLGGFLVWFIWIEAEPLGLWLTGALAAGLPEGSTLKDQLSTAAAHLRLVLMGLLLLLVLRFSPRGLIPEAGNGGSQRP